MKNTLLARLLGCYVGFVAAAWILPGIEVVRWTDALVQLAVLTLLYLFIRMITRPITLVFDMVLFGLPRFLLEAVILWGVVASLPGLTIDGYGWALLMTLIGAVGSYLARRLLVGLPSTQ
jgi:uncharacterized membrane protein YvlD (DUF360 family)